MELNKTDQQVLSTLFGNEVIEKISGALSGEGELSLGLRLNGKILTDEQQKELRENGIKQGKEIGYKEIAKNLDLELESGEKDAAKIAEKFKTNLSATFEEKYKSMTPTDELLAAAKKATEWEDKYKKLFDTHKQKEQEVTEWQEKYTQKEKAEKEEKLNNKILSVLPKDIAIDKGDALTIIRSQLSFAEEDGKLAILRGEKKYTDHLGDPEQLENVISAFTEEKGWIKKDGGMGGKNREGKTSPKGYTPEQARKYLIS